MTDARTWMAGCEPVAPAHLIERLEVESSDGETRHEALASAALRELDRARRAPGRVRESAFHLLAADALLTYACEAALGANVLDAVLEQWVKEAAARR